MIRKFMFLLLALLIAASPSLAVDGAPKLDVLDYLPYRITDQIDGAITTTLLGRSSWNQAVSVTESNGVYEASNIILFSSVDAPTDGNDLQIQFVLDGSHIAENYVFFLCEEASEDKWYVYLSTDGGATLANDNDPVLMLGDVDGSVANQVSNVNFLYGGWAEITIDGVNHIAVGEYNTRGEASGEGDDARIMVTSDGTTWAEAAAWNTDGSHYVDHIHGIYSDPYNTHHAMVCFGDATTENGMVYWDTNETLTGNQIPADYSTSAAVGLGSLQRYRTVAVTYTTDFIYWVSDTSADQGEAGIWRTTRDMIAPPDGQLNNEIFDRYGTAGYLGILASTGTQIFTEISTRGSSNECTVANATDLITDNANGLSTGDTIVFGGTALPTGITDADGDGTSDIYYVIVIDENTFKVAVTAPGADEAVAVDITSDGTDVVYYQSSPELRLWTAGSDDYTRWNDVATIHMENDELTWSPLSLFEANGRYYITLPDGKTAGKENANETVVFYEPGEKFYEDIEKHPTILHPVYWVMTADSDGSNSNDGYRPTDDITGHGPKLTVENILESDQVVYGSRIIVEAGTHTHADIAPNYDGNGSDPQSMGPVVVEGAGAETTIDIASSGVSWAIMTAEDRHMIVKNINIKLTNGGTYRVVEAQSGAVFEMIDAYAGEESTVQLTRGIYGNGGLIYMYRSRILGGANVESGLRLASTGKAYCENSIIKTSGTYGIFYDGDYLSFLHGIIWGFTGSGIDRRSGAPDPLIMGNVIIGSTAGNYAYSDAAGATEDDGDLNYNIYNLPHNNSAGGDSNSKGNTSCPAGFQEAYVMDQLFDDADSWDLSPRTPLINAGPDKIKFDVNGKPRPQGGVSEIGPVEYGTITTSSPKSVIATGQ